VDRRFSIQQAVAIGAKILAVGDSRSIQDLAGRGTRLIDLKGKTVIPGLMDDHYHMLSKALDQYLGVEIPLVGSIAEMLDAIKRKIEKTPPGEIVYTTSGWLPEQLKENRTPNRYDLDSVSPRNPVLVQGGHTYYLNSLALQLAGITKDTPSPTGGIIEKDPKTGEPTGLLVDNAMSLARKLIPLPTKEQKLRALRRAVEKENSVGITGVREPGIRPADMRVYQELRERGELTVRVSMNLDLDPNQPAAILVRQLSEWGVSTFFGDHLLRLDGIGEFLIDGGFEGGLMTEPYEYPATMGGKPYFGLQVIPTAKFEEVLEAANRYNWRACIHTVGDRAADILLDAYEKANREKPIARKRWVLEHGHYMRPNQFARIKKLGVVLSAQFHPYMAAQTMIHHWGRRRAEQSMRMRDWLDAGLTVGGGSDWSLVPANPFWMIYFWVTRNTRLWGVLGPEQRISREEALRVMTVNNAYLTFEEDVKGSIEPGKLADLVILSDDILTVPEEKIRDIKVLATFLGGKIVYESENSPIRFQ
jgi:predicted amidohydrolase YtcJ